MSERVTPPEPPLHPPRAALLSIVIPAYNEAARIGPTLMRIHDYVAQIRQPCEIVVVDDGSHDVTTTVVRGLELHPAERKLLSHPRNLGKGAAVRTGMLAAAGDVLLMCDADLSTPIREIEKLWSALEAGCDIAIGSRDLPDAVLDPPQPLGRRLLAWTFRAVRRRLLLPRLLDTQCGFKLFRRPAARAVFERLICPGWLFDCEVLGLAVALGYRIQEVGVVWRNDPATHVRPLREITTAIPRLLAIRRRVRQARQSATTAAPPGSPT